MLPLAEVPIHPKAVVACFERDYQPRYAAQACPTCHRFRGVAVMSNDPHKRWDEQYVVLCESTMERRTHILDVISED